MLIFIPLMGYPRKGKRLNALFAKCGLVYITSPHYKMAKYHFQSHTPNTLVMTTYRLWSEERQFPFSWEGWTLKPIDFIFIFSTPKSKIRWKMSQKGIFIFRNFKMMIPERRSVVGNNDHFSLALSKCFQSLSVSENIFPRFHHQGKPWIDVLNALFLKI